MSERLSYNHTLQKNNKHNYLHNLHSRGIENVKSALTLESHDPFRATLLCSTDTVIVLK